MLAALTAMLAWNFEILLLLITFRPRLTPSAYGAAPAAARCICSLPCINVTGNDNLRGE